ncbi:uncharacterized protein [Montipora capricornis]|uniref:uncharacterized protein n=1 Tax=Montipora capricornis TaxID=246305 RepID=UPI0035F10E16
MPRSFLVKRRKSEDTKSAISSDLLDNNNRKAIKINQDPLQPEAHCQTCMQPHRQFHPAVLRFNSLDRTQSEWYNSSFSKLQYRAARLSHSSENCVNMAAENPCLDPHCCECFKKTFDQHATCFCSNHPKPNFPPRITQLNIFPWCNKMNSDVSYQGACLSKNCQLSCTLLPTRKDRKDRKDREPREVSHIMDDHIYPPQTEKRMDTAAIKDSTKKAAIIFENSPERDNGNVLCTIVNKKTMITSFDGDNTVITKETCNRNTCTEYSYECTNQLNEAKDKGKNNLETKKHSSKVTPLVKMTQECTESKDNNELCSDVEMETETMDVQEELSFKALRKPQHPKSKKRRKDGIAKPYNTRMTTSRPRTYSSDFVMPSEEGEWKGEKDGFPAKGRQRSKLNRLLANEHERRRVAQLNSAYQDLRQLIPGYQCDTKLPKIKILKYAINYISHLDDILEQV